MNNTFYFLRHEVTKIDEIIPVSQWILTPEGEEKAKKLAMQNFFNDVDIIISSTEKKAYQTAKPIADKLKKAIIQIKEISELDRDKGGFMSPEKYEETVKVCLTNIYESPNKWESAAHALERFSKKIDELDKEYEHKKILIVGHGFTINLYFAHILGVMDKVHEKINTNTFGDWGIIKDKKVLMDIAQEKV